jgi:hypothetical protein
MHIMADFSAEKATVAAIQRDLDAKIADIRASKSLTTAGRRREMAAATLKAKQAAAQAKQEAAARREQERETAQRFAFGNVTDTSASDRLSARDAEDRARKIIGAKDAKAVMQQALLHNDKDLAQAVAARAHSRGWGDVVGQYSAAYGSQTFIDDLEQIPTGQKLPLVENILFRVRVPKELMNLVGDNDLQRLAESEVPNG